MSYLGKIVRKIKEGALKDIWQETKWIYRYSSAYKGEILIYILLGLAATAVGLLSGLVSRNLINLVVGGDRQQIRNMLTVAVVYVAMGLCRIGLNALSGRLSARITLRVNREMRADVYRKFLNTGWQSISQYHTGDLVSRLNSDVSTVAGSVLGWIPGLITGLTQFLGALLVILYFDPSMALIALLAAPVSILLMGTLAPKLRAWGLQVQEASANLSAFYTDSLQNLQSVKAFGLVDSFCQQQDGLQQKHFDLSLRQNKLSVGVNALMGLAGLAVSYLCLGWGVYRLFAGKIDFGTMVLFIQLAGYLSSAAAGLIQLGPRVIGATVSAQRLMSILELPAEPIALPPEFDTLSKTPLTVSMRDVSYEYLPQVPVLRHVDFIARPGEVTAVVGPSGCGKTTLLRLLLSLVTPDSGEAVLGDEEISVPLQPGLRTLFSYVPQQKALFSGTVAETLRLVKPEATEEELWAVLAAVDLTKTVAAMPQGLNSPIGENGSMLSEGQGQRLSIARALLRNAPVLLLDEATSALDVATERKILRNILSRTRTCIVTTHRPTVLSMCQRVYEIREGQTQVLTEAEIQARIQDF